ncbi:hypothetical protein GCM10010446_08300 [Streptomyces enissocaesilis]|uniref:Uncharacterized protein n=1 Tax=Streptomyces enissocaesilis TaxID=332589 RepID=A0ABN3WUS4_9ACTN
MSKNKVSRDLTPSRVRFHPSPTTLAQPTGSTEPKGQGDEVTSPHRKQRAQSIDMHPSNL